MGKAVKSVGKVFGLGGSATYKPQMLKKDYFDISKEVAPAQAEQKAALERQKGLVGVAAPMQKDVLAQMGQAALGKGPSLAEAQLKAASDRNLAQQLAATQGQRGGGALAQRSLLQNMGASGRDLAQQAAIERLKERDSFMQQANLAEAGLRQDVGSQLNYDLMPKQSLQSMEMTNKGVANQAAMQQAQQNQMGRGQLLAGLSTIGMKAMSGGAAPGAADGGLLIGPGTGKSDSIDARLSNGEFIVKADVVKKPGVLEHLMKLNDGETEMKSKKEYKNGGLVKKDDDMNPQADTIIPDKGWGAIIIKEGRLSDDKPKYQDGGLVKEKTSLKDVLMQSEQDVVSGQKAQVYTREDADTPAKRKKLMDAIEKMNKRGAIPLTPAGKKAADKKPGYLGGGLVGSLMAKEESGAADLGGEKPVKKKMTLKDAASAFGAGKKEEEENQKKSYQALEENKRQLGGIYADGEQKRRAFVDAVREKLKSRG